MLNMYVHLKLGLKNLSLQKAKYLKSERFYESDNFTSNIYIFLSL